MRLKAQNSFRQQEPSLSGSTRSKVEVVNHPQNSQLFDCVVVGAGAEIAKELGVHAGLDVKDGIVVNCFGQTSDQDIYAAGDVAIHPGLGYCIQSWAMHKIRRLQQQSRCSALKLNIAIFHGFGLINTTSIFKF